MGRIINKIKLEKEQNMYISKKNELRLNCEGELNQELDKALKKVLKDFGYELYGSGMSKDNIRDLAFTK